MAKKKAKQNKIKKLSKKEYHLKFLRETLENRKRVYNVYIEALVKYKIKDLAYSAIMADDLYNKCLLRNMEASRKKGESFMKFMFGGEKLTKEEQIKKDTEYYDNLIKHAQNRFEMSDTETKTKIAKDSIEKMAAWMKLPEMFEGDSS